jgi:hypothetical protein
MARALLSLLTVAVVIYALVDCWRSRPDEVQRLSRGGWAVVILVVPLLGAIAYISLGRVTGSATGAEHAAGTPRVVAPDDDPEFLRTLDFQRRQAAAQERRRREADEKADEKRRRAEQKAEQKAERKADRKTDRTADKPETGSPATGKAAEEHEETDGDDHSGHPAG